VRSCDVNVLVYAYDLQHPRQEEYKAWIEDVGNGPEAFGLPSIVLSAFMRIATHPRIFTKPLTPIRVIEIAEELLSSPFATPMEPGPRHWGIFSGLCRKVEAKGNTVPDAYLAALAIEHGCEWNTTDRGFARFPGLRWRHPIDH
jgi:toxin-antitoxin system PIN domain toxin